MNTFPTPRVLAVPGVRTTCTVTAAKASSVYVSGRPPAPPDTPADDTLLPTPSSVSDSPAPDTLPLLPVLPSTPAAAPGAVWTLPCTVHVKAAMGAAEPLEWLLLLLLVGRSGSARTSLQLLCSRAAFASCGVIVATAAPRGVLIVTCERTGSRHAQEESLGGGGSNKGC